MSVARTGQRKVGDLQIRHFALPRYTAFVSEVTRILDRADQGDPRAAEELLPLVYDELRRVAALLLHPRV